MKQTTIKNNIPGEDNEDIFLAELTSGYKRWKAEAAKIKDAGSDNSKELEYAEAYRVLINKFTMVEG